MSLMWAQMGTSIISAASQYSAQRHAFTMDSIAREYRENMSNISLAMHNNTLTQNEISARDALVRSGVALQVEGMKQESAAEAGAAAAGVSGGSVTNVMRGMMRSRLMAKHALAQRGAAQSRMNTQARRQAALSAAMNKDITPMVAPSPASALLGLGASLIDIYDSHQTPGNRTTDTMAGWGRN
jgi:hypothetical protein